jgi:drug/metabolite transporter (DMT)-like permease
MKTKKKSFAILDGLNPAGLANLLVIYVVWSTTYLAIRYAVREGAGFPPFTMGFMRAALAALVLLAWAAWRRERLRLTRAEFITLSLSGLLLWLGGNGLVTFAEQHAESSLAALMVAAIPIWGSVIDAILDRKWPSLRLVLSLLIGFSGIAVLTAPELLSGVEADVVSVVALLGAALSWAIGSVLQARRPMELSARTSSAYQMGFGAIGFLVVLLLAKEPLPTPTTEAWVAWAYLTVIGSIVAFTAYVSALRLLPIRIVMTYAYVNPVLAVLLGSVMLKESITIWTAAGAVLVLLGVAGVFQERQRARNATSGK